MSKEFKVTVLLILAGACVCDIYLKIQEIIALWS